MPIDATNKLVLAFVTLIIGLVLVGVVAGETQNRTTTLRDNNQEWAASGTTEPSGAFPNESLAFVVNNPPSTWKEVDSGQNCWITSFLLKNITGAAVLNFTEDTDYNLDANNGTWYWLNTSTVRNHINSTNSTFADYSYCGDDYLNQSWGRTVLNLTPGFFAIALLLVSVGLFYSVAKDYQII